MFLTGRTAFVTGGGRGIGRAIAERLAAEGARVIAAARTGAEIEDVARRVGGSAVLLDVGDRASIERALAGLDARIDILVNNAGTAESAPLARTTDALWDVMLAVNVTGAFALCRALVPAMVRVGWGRVVNVASDAGLTGYAYGAAYCASKHALVGLTRALAAELARTGVTVNAVCPGFVRTQLTDETVARIAGKTKRSPEQALASVEAFSPQNRLIEPDEVAHAVAALCAEGARGIHGQAIVIDGGQVMK